MGPFLGVQILNFNIFFGGGVRKMVFRGDGRGYDETGYFRGHCKT